MTDPVQVSPLGAVVAAAFAIPMAALLLWMLRIPHPVPQEVARAVRSVGAVKTILVPILEHYYSERAVELASRLGEMQRARILLGYVVVVPRTLSLGVALPSVEGPANAALAEAKTIVKMHGLEAEAEIIRAREAGEGIARVARGPRSRPHRVGYLPRGAAHGGIGGEDGRSIVPSRPVRSHHRPACGDEHRRDAA